MGCIYGFCCAHRYSSNCNCNCNCWIVLSVILKIRAFSVNFLLCTGARLQKLIGQIKFVDVSFHYPSRPSLPVLQHFNLTVYPGEVVALVGLSGSGKSTIVNLLLRLYEPTNGEVNHFSLSVEWAAKQAFAHDFISALPNGYQTLVDDDLLSGGQKQRIAIAGAILWDSGILILDEATSALDAESEYDVKVSADRIIVMDDGKIVEMGSHIGLLRNDGLYARLIRKKADAVA